jgi:hypothetical protein
MDKSLISRAMRQLVQHRHAMEDPELLREIVSKAGRASWEALTEEERQARIAKMVAARQKKPRAIAKAKRKGDGAR